MNNLLQIENASKTFGQSRVLSDVSFSLDEGEVHCLAGGNGCGKSTLIKIITGVHQPDPGCHIFVGGKRIDKMTPSLSKSLGIQVIFQDFALFPNLTVAENIAIDLLRERGIAAPSKSKILKVAEQASKQIEAKFDLNATLGDLPVSQRQMVAIARALASDAKVIFMDEPTASLTENEVSLLLAIVKRLKADNISVVFVSHRLREVLTIADRVTVIRDGALVSCLQASETNEILLSEQMTGAAYSYTPPKFSAVKPPLMIVKNLSREGEYEDVSFSLGQGEVLGIVGRLGSGRTELAHTLFGMTKADHGKILLENQPYRPRNNGEAIASGVCYLSEDRRESGLVLDQSIAENFIVSILDDVCNRFGIFSKSKRAQTVQRLIDELEVKVADAELDVSTLSGGNQQRVSLGKNIATNPKIIILDSPTVGVDVKAKDAIYRAVTKLSDNNISIIMISDEVEEVYYHTHRVLVMKNGTLGEEHITSQTSIKDLGNAVFQ